MARLIGWGKRGAGEIKDRESFRRGGTVLGFAALLAAGLLTAGAIGGSGQAFPLGSSGSATDTGLSFLSIGPTISSDREDYEPGSTVTLTGHGWAPEEIVHIFVNDDKGQTWSYTTDVTADLSGDFTLHFVLPTTFVATYSVTATGPISGTATTSFTDGNVKFVVAPGGQTATFVEHMFQSSTNCTGTERTNGGFPKTLTNSTGDNVGVGQSESVRIDAAATSDSGLPFKAWSTTDGSPFTVLSPDRFVCIPGFNGNGTRNYVATYDNPPAINRTNSSVTVSEPTTATNTGTWSDPDSGDTVALSASVGTVTKAGTNASGTWSWSFGPTDGPADNQTVTITANDGTTSASTTFSLTVNNLPPAISSVTNDGPIDEGGSATITVDATDPAGVRDPLSYEYDCNNDGTFEVGPQSSNSNSCTYNDNGSKQVNVRVTDGDSGSATGSTTVTVRNVAPAATLANNGPVDEGSPATITFSAPSDPSSADTAAGFHYSYACNGDASALATTYAGATDGTSKQCTFPDGPAMQVVKGRIFDKDGDSTTYDTTVEVKNVAPNVTAAANQNSTEGTATSFTLGSFSDPGPDSPWAVDVDWGDSSTHTTFSQSATGSLGTQSHEYDDNGTYTVTVQVTDDDGGSNTAAFTVSVSNVAPTADLGNNGPVDEGSPVAVTFTNAADPSNADTAAGFHYAFSCTNGDLSGTTYAGSGTSASTSCTFDDEGSYAVKGRIIDKDEGFTQYTTNVTVENVAPSVNVSDQMAFEGTSESFSLGSFSDPGTNDDPWSVHVDWGDGTSSDLPDFDAQGALGDAPHTYSDGPNSYTVTVTVTDEDGDSGSGSFTVDVVNVEPTLTGPADDATDEGTAKSFSLGSFSDPGTDDDPWSVHVDWGDGSSNDYVRNTQGPIGSEPHTYDDDGIYTVTITVTDKDSDVSDPATFAVDVANVPPTAALSNDGPVDEGEDATISFAAQFDPSNADTSSGFHYAYACDGDASFLPTTYAGATFGSSTTCLFADGPTEHDVVARIFDKDDGYTEYTTHVVVNNKAPEVTGPADQDAYEGTSESFELGTFTDAGVYDNPWTVVVDWGDGTSSFAPSLSALGSIGSASHTYADNGTYTVTVSVADKDGASDSATFDIEVANVAPLVIGPSDQNADEGTSSSFDLGSFTDKGLDDDPWSVDVDWGDGTDSDLSFDSQGDLGSTSHTYGDEGTYTVTVTVTDKDGDSGQAIFHVIVANVAPTVTAADDQSSDEGQAASFDLGSFSDPGLGDDPWSVHVAWGDGSSDDFVRNDQGAIGSESHTYDDNGTYTVSVTVTDEDAGSSDPASFQVTVSNVDPTADLANDGPVGEGSPVTVSFSNQQDPSGADTAAGFHYAYDCENGSLAGASYAGSGSSESAQCTFDDGPSTHTVRARIIDKDGGFSEYTTEVTVTNVEPTATLSNDGPVAEGSAATVSFSNQDDPSDADTAAGFHYVYACENGDLSGATYVGSTDETSSECMFADNGTYTVKARIIDKDDGYSEYTTDVVVENVAPVVTAADDQSSDEGSSHDFDLGSFSDVGVDDDPWAVHVDWGDGEDSDGSRDAQGGLGTSSHSYDDNDNYTVTVTVADKDGDSGQASFQVTVSNVDPTADLGNDGPVDEGSPATVSFSNQDDPSGADTAAGFHYAYDCANGSLAGVTYATATFGPSTTCMYADNGTYPVRARIIDKDDGFSEYTTAVVVQNADPIVTAAAGQSSNEGSPASFDLGSFSDAGVNDAPWEVDVDWGDGLPNTTSDQSTQGSLGSRSHTYDDNDSYTVKVRVTDKDGGSGEASFTVTVSNVAPTASISNNGAVDEGSPATVSFSGQSDPSGADTAAGFHYAYSCSNGDLSGATYAGSGTNASTQCTYSDNGTYTVKGRIIDKDGGYSEYTTDVQVTNVNPMVTPPSDQNANEGTSTLFALGSFSDPGADSPWKVHVDWGDGQSSDPADRTATGALGSAGHSYADNGPYTVTVTVTDKDGGSGWATFMVTVANVAPTASLSNNGPVDEGTPATISFSGQSDPSSADTAAGFHYAYSCTNGDLSGATYAGSGTSGSTSCTFDDGPATKTVRARIIDKDGSYSEYTTNVTVNNVKPTASLSNNGPVDEGSPATISFSGQSDPSSADTAAGFHYAYDCAGGSLTGATYAGSGTSGSTSCTFDDGPATKTVRARIIDKDGSYSEYTTNVTVNNVKPTITSLTGTATGLSGPLVFVPVTFNGVFTDPGMVDNPWTGNWSWDGTADPSATQAYPANGTTSHSFSQTHQYTTAGCNHTATIKVTDDDGAYDTRTVTVGVGSGAFLPPMTNQPVTNKLRNNQVLPVKIQITGCNGAPVNNLTPAIRLGAGDQTASSDDAVVTITPPSVSAADTSGVMRPSGSDGSYIYNMNVSISLSTDYTVVIYPYYSGSGTPSGATLRHVIQATK